MIAGHRVEVDRDEILDLVEEKGGIGTWSWDFRTGAVAWSVGIYRLLGYAPGEIDLTFQVYRSMVHPEDRLPESAYDRHMVLGEAIDREFRIIRRNGTIRWVATRGEVISGPDGRPARAVGVVIDISRLREAELSARIANRRFQALTESLAAAVWSAALDGSGGDLSAWCRLTGQSEAEADSWGWLEAVHPDDRVRVVQSWETAVRTREPYEADYRLRQADGLYRWVNSRAAPVRGLAGEVIEWVGLVIDLEARRRLGGASAHPGPIGGIPVSAQPIVLTGAQLRAARAILGWSVQDLAARCGVSCSTIRRMEQLDGTPPTRDHNVTAIRRALEEGVEFIFLPDGKPGLRPR